MGMVPSGWGTSWGTTARKYERLAKIYQVPRLRMSFMRMRRWYKAFTREFDKQIKLRALREIAFEFLEEVIPKTPVDSGRARASWTVYYDKKGKTPPSLSDITEVNKWEAPDLQYDKMAEGKELGKALEGLTGPYKFITIISRVPYMTMLEYGRGGAGWAERGRPHSKQSQAFIRISLEKIKPKMKSVARQSTKNAVAKATVLLGAQGKVWYNGRPVLGYSVGASTPLVD